MIKHIKPLPISEEMLGAYLEGNLNPKDARYVELLIENNPDFSALIDELSVSEDLESDIIDETPVYGDDFELPDIALDTHSCLLVEDLEYDSDYIDSSSNTEYSSDDSFLMGNAMNSSDELNEYGEEDFLT